MANDSINNPYDKEAAIIRLQAELERKTKILTEMYEKRNREEKRLAKMGKALTDLHNENQMLKRKIYVLENPAEVSVKQRRKYI